MERDEGVMTKEYYCPSCGFEIVVSHVGTDFDTCECEKCGGIMLEKEKEI